jgi:hypothetical protein
MRVAVGDSLQVFVHCTKNLDGRRVEADTPARQRIESLAETAERSSQWQPMLNHFSM